MIMLWVLTFNYYILTVWFGLKFYIVIFIILGVFFVISILKYTTDESFPKKIVEISKGNRFLVLFLYSLYLEILVSLLFLLTQDFFNWKAFLTHFLIVLVLENIVFWSGMVRVYAYSVQLGIKWRVIGIICGWTPVLQIVVLYKIINITKNEVLFEKENFIVNSARAKDAVCNTKYPILLVHGVFFRDSTMFNYWGRIPSHLEGNGATIYYGEHESASSIEDSGIELALKIKRIVNETGCEKVNIIAHSKGGLDCRYAISSTDAKEYVASLTTVNTPHYGCLFADYLLDKISPKIKNSIAKKYNSAAKAAGDKNPDFMKAVHSLTSKSCYEFNQKVFDNENVYYQSVGSKMNRASSGRFPLNIVYPLVKHFDGENDGLVAVTSMQWADNFTFVTTPKGRGVSHADIIDLNRENISNFNVREFYTEVVHDLKVRGF
jgi:triacylglycerol lipase